MVLQSRLKRTSIGRAISVALYFHCLETASLVTVRLAVARYSSLERIHTDLKRQT